MTGFSWSTYLASILTMGIPLLLIGLVWLLIGEKKPPIDGGDGGVDVDQDEEP